tara:strand:- start:1903 stop:2088 length:186 start_codon:yes stop_codon:yes gene_type:complete
VVKKINKMNWINSWKQGNKQAKYNIEIRLGRVTILEIKVCMCDKKQCSKFRLMLLNFGFEI